MRHENVSIRFDRRQIEMKKWKLGASVKDFSKLDEYARHFDFLEIDLEKAMDFFNASPTSISELGSVAEAIMPYKEKIYSVHLRYNPAPECGMGGIDATIRDLYVFAVDLIREIPVRMFVTHTDYPTNSAQFEEQVRILSHHADRLSTHLAIENLCDRKDKTHGYLTPRNPRDIAELLEKIGNPFLGLCIDTGHAISNAALTDSLNWDNDLIRKWVSHFHYNDNTTRMDAHMPISSATDERIIASFKHMLEQSANSGVVIFENRKLGEAIQSLGFVQTPAYVDIAPAPMR